MVNCIERAIALLAEKNGFKPSQGDLTAAMVYAILDLAAAVREVKVKL